MQYINKSNANSMTTFLQTKLQWLTNAYDHNVVLCTFKDANTLLE